MKPARVILAAAAVGALTLLGAAPASAAGATIDPGDSLYSINCDTEAYNDWQLMSVDPSTAVSTPIGDGAGGVNDSYYACAGQPAYNPATGKSYYIQNEYTDGTRTFLAGIDVTTGVSTRIGEFFRWNNEFPEYPRVTALAIDKAGNAFAILEALGEFGRFASVDLETGELTILGSEGLCCTWALAVHPVTDVLYGIDDWNGLFSVDKASGHFEFVGTVNVPDGAIYSLQIDEGGRFWVMAESWNYDEEQYEAHLWSSTLTTLDAPVHSGEFVDDPYYTEALLLIPGKGLAATGATVGALPIAAGMLLLLGTAVVATVAIRRRTTTA